MKRFESRGSRRPAALLAAALLAATAVHAADDPSAAPPKRPNLLFAIADDWGYGHAGAYGCRWVKTPAFDRVAKDGLLFTHAFTPNAKCAPSRACILTGRNSWQLGAACNHVPFFPPEFKTWAEALAENGWHVGMTCKGWAPGVANDAGGRPRRMAGAPFNRRTAPPPTSGISNNDYAANFDDFLDAAPKDAPWCFWYGAVEPHRGYEYGSGAAKGGKKTSEVDRVPGYWPDTEVVRNDLLDYALEVEHFDRHLGRMLASLERRGLLDDTLVVVTSDNGMPFPRCKGQEYDFSNHLPLAVMWKKGIRAPGRTIDDYVSFIDFAPTFVELAGLAWERTGMAPATGRSLVEILRSDRGGRVVAARDHVLIGKERHDVGRPNDGGYPIRAIVKEGMIYVRNYETSRWPAGNPETGYLNCDGGATKTEILNAHRKDPNDRFWALCFGKRPAEELYDLAKDPDCLANLAGSASHEEIRKALEKQMTDELKAQDDPRMEGKGEVFDRYPYANEGQRGFYEKFMRGEKVKAGWVNESDFEKGPVD
jgi:arylsulfatase A-like enzyme